MVKICFILFLSWYRKRNKKKSRLMNHARQNPTLRSGQFRNSLDAPTSKPRLTQTVGIVSVAPLDFFGTIQMSCIAPRTLSSCDKRPSENSRKTRKGQAKAACSVWRRRGFVSAATEEFTSCREAPAVFRRNFSAVLTFSLLLFFCVKTKERRDALE